MISTLFFLVMDKDRTIAKCVAYKEVADKWRKVIKKGRVYEISNCNIGDKQNWYDNFTQVGLKLASNIE